MAYCRKRCKPFAYYTTLTHALALSKKLFAPRAPWTAAAAAAASEMDPVMRSSTDPVANAVLMLLERVDLLERRDTELRDKFDLLEAELLATKEACATTVRFEAAIQRFDNSVSGLAKNMDGVLSDMQYAPIHGRREQEAWLHQHTCGMRYSIDSQDVEMIPSLAAFLERNPGKLHIYLSEDANETRNAVWVAAHENVVDKMGVFHNCVTGNQLIVMAE